MMKNLILKRRLIFLFAIFSSLLLSFWFYIKSAVINLDGICYLQSSEAMRFGIHFASHLCEQAKWPFYSFMIFKFSTLFKISSFTTAFILDSVFSLLSVISFLLILNFLKVTPRILWLGALVILLAPQFNSVREYIIRDHGFWAFYLLSLFFLLRYHQYHFFRDAIFWSLCLCLATLFRIEAVFFLLLLPILFFFDFKISLEKRFQSFVCLNIFSFLLVSGLFLWMSAKSINLSRIHEVQFQIFHGLTFFVKNISDKIELLRQHVLGFEGARDAIPAFLSLLVGDYLINLVVNLSLIYTLLVLYALIKKSASFSYSNYFVLFSYILINIVITFLFLSEHLFLSKRYLMALSLVLLLWVPYALNDIMERYKHKKSIILILFFLIFISTFHPIVDTDSHKRIIKEAGVWLAEQVPNEATIYTNSIQLMYYSNHFNLTLFDTLKRYSKLNPSDITEFKKFDFLAILINHRDDNHFKNALKQKHVIKVFENKYHDQIIIYH